MEEGRWEDPIPDRTRSSTVATGLDLDDDAQKSGGFRHTDARRCCVVDRSDGARGVEVVVQCVADLGERAGASPCAAPRVQPTSGGLEQPRRPVVLLAIGVAEDAEADRARIPLLQQVADE